jgi:hypothetical protein
MEEMSMLVSKYPRRRFVALFIMAAQLMAAVAHAGSPSGHKINVTNKSNGTRTVLLYNNNDTVLSIPASQKALGVNETASLACNTQGSCKMYIEEPRGGRDYGVVSYSCIRVQEGGGLLTC